MRHLCLAALLAIAPTYALAQPATLAPPDRARVDGVPPIPTSVVDLVSPYGQFRQARLLGWHPTERRLLISTVFGNVSQLHEVRAPGGARTQLTFYRDGVTGAASYDPSGRFIVFRKDTSGGGEAMQLFRYDLASGSITLLTDGRSRHGVPVWARRGGLVAFTSTRRNGKDRDLLRHGPGRARVAAHGRAGRWRLGRARLVGERRRAAGARADPGFDRDEAVADRHRIRQTDAGVAIGGAGVALDGGAVRR